FHRVKAAITSAGAYTARESVAWHRVNNCLGCHIQTQSLLGLQSSLGKADVDEATADYLLREILSSQLGDGTIRRSHPEYAKNQTAFALWALNYVPDRDRTFVTREKGLAYLWSRRQVSGNQMYWSTDHASGWLDNTDAMTALVAQSINHFVADAAQRDSLTDSQLTLINNYQAQLPAIAEYFLARAANTDNQDRKRVG